MKDNIDVDFVVYRVLDAPSKVIFDRFYTRLILLFLVQSFLTYVSFELISNSTLGVLLESSLIKSLVEIIPLDYSYFIYAGNSSEAGRVWLMEITILVWLFVILGWIAIVSLRLAFLKGSTYEKLGREPLLQKSFLSAVITVLFLVIYPWSGISKALITGQYKVSFGPNDLAILWLVALAFIAVAVSWMAFFFLMATVSKVHNLLK